MVVGVNDGRGVDQKGTRRLAPATPVVPTHTVPGESYKACSVVQDHAVIQDYLLTEDKGLTACVQMNFSLDSPVHRYSIYCSFNSLKRHFEDGRSREDSYARTSDALAYL